MSVLEVARRGSLHSEAAEILRRAIFSGRLIAGARLNETRVSAEIGVSRGPLREAFRELEEEGVVVSSPNRGTYVAAASADEFSQVVSIRRLIEPFVIEQALRRDRDKLLAELRDSVARINAAARKRDSDQVARQHTRFHAHFYRFAGGIYYRLWERLQVALSLYVVLRDPVLLVDVPREHEELLRLVEAGDIKVIARDLDRHLSANFATTIKAFDRASPIVRSPTRSIRRSRGPTANTTPRRRRPQGVRTPERRGGQR